MAINASFLPQEWKFYEALWRERNWMVRRVDRTSIIDRNRVQLDITFTIDNRAILRLISEVKEIWASQLENAEKVPFGSISVPLPLFQWERAPILDVDVRDRNGGRLAVATGDANIKIAECILLHQAYDAGFLDSNLELDLFNRFSSDLFYVLRTGSYRRCEILLTQADEILRSNSDGTLTESQAKELSYLQEYWTPFFRLTDGDTLASFMQSHIFVSYVEISSATDYQVISCRLVYNNVFEIGKFQFGRDTYRHDIEATGFDSLDKRVHVRVQAPQGMRIAYLELTNIEDGNLVPASHLRAKMTPDFVELLRNNEDGYDKVGMSITLHYMPKRSTFVSPATVLSLVYCAMLVIVMIPNAETEIAAILAAVPTIAAAFLSKDIAHDIASHVCERSRWMFAYVSAAVFLSSTMLSVLSSTNFVWFARTISLLTLTTSFLFLASNVLSLKRMRRLMMTGCCIRDNSIDS